MNAKQYHQLTEYHIAFYSQDIGILSSPCPFEIYTQRLGAGTYSDIYSCFADLMVGVANIAAIHPSWLQVYLWDLLYEAANDPQLDSTNLYTLFNLEEDSTEMIDTVLTIFYDSDGIACLNFGYFLEVLTVYRSSLILKEGK